MSALRLFAAIAVLLLGSVLAIDLLVVAPNNNDVVQLLSGAIDPSITLRTFDDLDSALSSATAGNALLVLNPSGPSLTPAPVSITLAQYQKMGSLRLAGVYLEQPSLLPNNEPIVNYTQAPYYNRVVIVSNSSTMSRAGLTQLEILQAQGGFWATYRGAGLLKASAAVSAVVAGSGVAVYGLPNATLQTPVLFQLPLPAGAAGHGGHAPAPQAWVGALQLSCVQSCRYSPVERWVRLWNFILSSVLGTTCASFPSWTPLVRPALPAPPSELNPPPANLDSFHASTDWLAKSSQLLFEGDQNICPAPYAPAGANIVCMLEGYGSALAPDGSQPISNNTRMDCSAETAMALALRAYVDGSSAPGSAWFMEKASDLLNYVWLYSDAFQGTHNNVSDETFGLLAWGTQPEDFTVCTYPDDNGRVLTSSIIAAGVFQSAGRDVLPWATPIIRNLLGTVRITGITGFRPGRVNFADVYQYGWMAYWNSTAGYMDTPFQQPHFQSQAAATFAWAYAVTGFGQFLDRAVAYMEGTMAIYHTNRTLFTWTEYLSEEQVRLTFALSWLLHAEDSSPSGRNATHVQWLYTVAKDLLATQQPFGAIRDTLGAPNQCMACPCPSNDNYGTQEASLIGKAGDPLTDQLYSSNFALSALWEAYKATGDTATFGIPARALASYLASIQVVSDQYPYLSGSWMRGFDYQQWEIWGAAGDHGWGPWSVESGWTTTWIAAGQAGILEDLSLWDISMASTQTGPDGRAAVDWKQLFDNNCRLFFNATTCAQ